MSALNSVIVKLCFLSYYTQKTEVKVTLLHRSTVRLQQTIIFIISRSADYVLQQLYIKNQSLTQIKHSDYFFFWPTIKNLFTADISVYFLTYWFFFHIQYFPIFNVILTLFFLFSPIALGLA